MSRPLLFLFASWLSLLMTATAGAAEMEPLPEPLTLEAALAIAERAHPELELSAAAVDAARADLASAEALEGTRLTAQGRLRYVEPSYKSSDPSNNDSSAGLVLRKRLYDFGYSEASQQRADLRLQGREQLDVDKRLQRRLQVMRRYFDVLLADLAFARDNEDMAVAYVTVDKLRERHGLGQVSDLDLLEAEAAYQKSRHQRFVSQSQLRITRNLLSVTLNRPDDLPASLVMPEADVRQLAIPVEDATAQVLARNPGLLALRAGVAAAEQAVAMARNAHGPVLSGEIEATVYNRTTASTSPLGAGLLLEIPILTGGERDAGVAAARAELRGKRAELDSRILALRQQVLELWMSLDNLRIRMDEVNALESYRDLYLDRSRALYQMEVKTDLGDAMVQTTAVAYQKAKIRFEWLLAHAQLEALGADLSDSGRMAEELTGQ